MRHENDSQKSPGRTPFRRLGPFLEEAYDEQPVGSVLVISVRGDLLPEDRPIDAVQSGRGSSADRGNQLLYARFLARSGK